VVYVAVLQFSFIPVLEDQYVCKELFRTLYFKITDFRYVTPCSVVKGSDFSEEIAAPIFTVE